MHLFVCSMLDDATLDKITPSLLGDMPNTYTYTKQIAEHLLVTEGKDLPLAIVRLVSCNTPWISPQRARATEGVLFFTHYLFISALNRTYGVIHEESRTG